MPFDAANCDTVDQLKAFFLRRAIVGDHTNQLSGQLKQNAQYQVSQEFSGGTLVDVFLLELLGNDSGPVLQVWTTSHLELLVSGRRSLCCYRAAREVRIEPITSRPLPFAVFGRVYLCSSSGCNLSVSSIFLRDVLDSGPPRSG